MPDHISLNPLLCTCVSLSVSVTHMNLNCVHVHIEIIQSVASKMWWPTYQNILQQILLLLCSCNGSTWVIISLVWSTNGAVGQDTQPPSRLVMAQILFRHGMRAPEDPYPTDPFQDASVYWPNGWGQLTDFGKEQQYQLGKYLRSRYSTLLSSHYIPEEIKVISSGYDRTVASALLALAGLYPNTVRNQYNYSHLTWQPIPIQTLNAGSNKLMFHPSYLSKSEVCPRYYNLLQEIDSHPIVQKALKENHDLVENLKNWTGIGETKTWKHIAAGYMMGTVKIEKFYNLSIPQWAEDVISSPSNRQFFTQVFATLALTPEMRRLAAGPIITEWIQHMQSHLAGNETAKLYMYSAHDLNLFNVLTAMDLNDPPRLPEMGSTLFIELYDDHTVRLAYRDGLTTEITNLSLPGCDLPCKLDAFENMLKPHLVEDLDRECEHHTHLYVDANHENASVTVLESVLIAVICILTLMLLGLEVYHRKVRNKSKMYTIESK